MLKYETWRKKVGEGFAGEVFDTRTKVIVQIFSSKSHADVIYLCEKFINERCSIRQPKIERATK